MAKYSITINTPEMKEIIYRNKAGCPRIANIISTKAGNFHRVSVWDGITGEFVCGDSEMTTEAVKEYFAHYDIKLWD